MTQDEATPPLVDTQWLSQRLGAPDLRILDASYHLPDAGRDARAEFEAGHIPGARFFDIDDIADASSALPHMLPGAAKFASRVRRLGVGDGHHVVVYDATGLFSAPRAWWMFRVFGHARVSVLDGGLPKWRAEGLPVTEVETVERDRHFSATRDGSLVRDVTQVAAAVKLGGAQIVDARAPERFRGEAPEPRPGARGGHIPGSLNVHYRALLNADGTMKRPEALRAVFAEAGVDLERPIVNTCGSGVTACILSLAQALCGAPPGAVYDGSWTEWGGYPDLPVAK
jgi:thiosulfate/3-mercaptopyruvate sulfurtransferase